MLFNIFLLISGSIMLYYGAEWIVKGSVNIATKLGISSLIIGLTVVAFGTSLPELIVSVIAALEGSSAIAVGNVVGSNVANVGLVLGLSAFIFPITIIYDHLKRDLLIYLAVSALFVFFALDGRISQFEGLVLFVSLIFYILLCVKSPVGLKNETQEIMIGSIWKLMAFIIGGIALLSLGADIFVEGAIFLARYLGVSEVIIGMSVVALGTSLPELATSAMAAFRKESSLSVGNIVGSNIFNILSVLGIASLIHPLESPKEIIGKEVIFMIAYGLSMLAISKLSQPINRLTSSLLILGYLFFIYMLF